MSFLAILELCFTWVALAFFVTQIVWPLLSGKPVFPMVRGKMKAQEKLNQAKDNFDAAAIQKEAEWIEKQTKKIGRKP